MYNPIQVERLYEQVIGQIQDRIISGELRPGDRLPSERELAEQLNVSRTVIREAVKALSQKGLVEIRTGRGTFITDGTPEAVRHSIDLMMRLEQASGQRWVVEVREIIEPEIAARAAGHMTDECLGTMQAAIDAMENSIDDIDSYVAADMRFHTALAEAAGNPLILKLIDTIFDLLQEQRKRIGRVSHGPQRAQMHHKLIFEAVKRGDEEAARQAMRAHLEQVRVDTELVVSGNL